MYIDHERCARCGSCIPYCPMGAITRDPAIGRVAIDQDACVECEVCLRSGACTHGGLTAAKLRWPRILRSRFSNPMTTHPDTSVPGRGTEEMKTNEVTGRVRRGQAGMVVEVGRPGVGARLRDVEKLAMTAAAVGVHFEPDNPVTRLMTDQRTGRIREDVANEKVLSAIIELRIPQERIGPLLQALARVQSDIDTVFSVGVYSRLESDGTDAAARIAAEAGASVSIHGKTNVGLGRPLAEDK